MTSSGARSRRPFDLAAALLLVWMAGLLWWRADMIGPTVDEPYHLMRGLAWWWTDSTKLSYAHPPLANLLQGLPALWHTPPVDLTTLDGWKISNHAIMAKQLFREHYAEARALLFAGRAVTSVLALLLAALVYGWTSRRVGRWEGIVALVLVVANPTILAHGQMLTTDLPVALATAAVGLSFVEYLQPRARSIGRWLSLGAFAVAVAVALGTKFTALALVPLLGGIGAVWAARGWGRFEGTGRRDALIQLGLDITVVAATTLFALAALYRFEEVGLTMGEILDHPEPQCHVTRDLDHQMLEQRTISMLPRWLPMPVPFTWLFGVEMVRQHAGEGHSTWFAGLRYGWGNPAYFPVMLLIKTPWATLVGLFLVIRTAVRRRRWPRGFHGILLGLAAFLLALLMRSHLNIGVRHALPVVPLLTVVAASGLVQGARWARLRFGPQVSGAAVGLLVLLPLTTAAHAGHYLSWFNIGSVGHRISMVGEDWAQDTIHLAETIREHDLKPLYYVNYGVGYHELLHQGIKARRVRCGHNIRRGWLALHAANHVRDDPEDMCFPGQTEWPPDFVVADHIYVWRIGDDD